MPRITRFTSRVAAALSVALCIAATARADFFLLDNIDLDANFGPVGNNPMSVTFDGTYAYVGGYNGSGLDRDVGILKVNVFSPTERSALATAVQNVKNLHYYHGLVVREGILYALMDRPDDTVATTNIRAIDVATDTLVETFDGDDLFNPGNGIVTQPAGLTFGSTGGLCFDPGFGEVDSGLAFFGFGSGRRLMIDVDTGTSLYTQTTGMIVSDPNFSDQTAWRDCWFDANGDLYQRRSNQVQRAIRNGGNSIDSREHLTDELNPDGTPRVGPGDGKAVAIRVAAFVVGQNLALIKRGGGAGPDDLIIFNDRPFAGDVPPPLSFASTIKIIKADGSLPAAPVQLLKGDGSPLDPATDTPDGNGVYDFHYATAQDLLLILDFTNRNLLVFTGSAPAPGACCLVTGECTEVTALACGAAGGAYQGDGVPCTPRPCPCSDPFADIDGDGDVDSTDFAALQRCFTALPGSGSVAVAAACECFDRDNGGQGDGDIDLDDLAAFEACADGPAVFSDTTCDGGP